MKQVQLFETNSILDLEEHINNFLKKGFNVIDIKYSHYILGEGRETYDIWYTAMAVYEEGEKLNV